MKPDTPRPIGMKDARAEKRVQQFLPFVPGHSDKRYLS